MLVLGRRVDQALVIDGDIIVMVVSIDRDGKVKLGVVAPANVEIIRAELVANGRWRPKAPRHQRLEAG